VPAVVVFMLGFEFAIVSVLPLAANMVPGASGAGLGLAVGAGTSGRAVFSAVGTLLLDRAGSSGPTIAALVLAVGAGVLVRLYARGSR
jgi:predicted MFS family arabinose efflux permease